MFDSNYMRRLFTSKVTPLVGMILLLTSISSWAEVRFLSTEEPPTNFVHDGKFTGLTTELVREIRDRLGWSNKVEVYPWSRAYQIALSTPNVLVFTVGRTSERDSAGFKFVGPISTRTHGIFTRKHFSEEPPGQRKLSQKPIAVMRDDWRASYLRSEGFKVLDTNDHAQGFRMLVNQRVDYWLSSDLEAPLTARLSGFDIADIKMVSTIKKAGSYMAFSPGTDPALIEVWRETYRELQQTDYFEKERVRWSRFLNAEMEYSPASGYVIRFSR